MITISKQQKGFTLVELIVVIVILGILSAVAAPKFFEVDTYKERVFKDELVAALRYAQKRAVASGCEVLVEIKSDGYTLYRQANSSKCNTDLPTLPATKLEHPAGGDFIQTYKTPSGLTVDTGNILFDALGLATSSTYTLSEGSYANVGLSGITVWGETGCVTQ